VTLEVSEGPLKGERIETANVLFGKLELDKVFQPGDSALVVIKGKKGNIQVANLD